MLRFFGPIVVVVGTLACGSTSIDVSTYETTCVADAECILIAEDVCAGCAAASVSASERARADAETEAALGNCLFGQAECLQTQEPACIDGQCGAVPLGEAG